jgi:hypothetical protein
MLPVLLAIPAAIAAGPAALNWYEWIEPAPIVVTGRPVGDEGGYELLSVERVLRGAPPAERVVRIDVGRANRERDRLVHRHALRLETGIEYLLLLDAPARESKGSRPTYALVRGVGGVRELPAEGAESVIRAVVRFVQIQDSGDHEQIWRSMADLLESTDPLLTGTALDQILKFRRGEVELLPLVRPLLDHPSADLRERAARLIGQVLERARGRAEEVPEPQRLRDELVARARRDGSVAVRVAATEALAELDEPSVWDIVGEIADDDPDQGVRFAAEKLIYEHRLRVAPGGER